MRRQVVGQSRCILGRLSFNSGERALGLCLDRAYGLAVEIEQVIGKAEARFHWKFARGDASPSGEVQVFPVLDEPARGHQVGVDIAARSLFRVFGHV